MKRVSGIQKMAAAVIAAMALLGSACGGSTNGEDVITATDLDAAAQAVIDEMQPEVAEALTIAEVKADAVLACGVIADVPNSQPGNTTASQVGAPKYADAVEADDNSVDNLEFLTLELPYVSIVGKHFCPAEAVRANLV